MVLTLGYWDIRGLANPIRLLLEYTETPYQERLYRHGPAEPSDWSREKEKLGLDFPNLPYLIDGSTKLTQSNAILRYIARKHNMCGETEVEKQHMDMLENHLMDVRMAFARLCYNPDFEKLKPAYLEQLPGKLRELSRFLGSQPWFVGGKLTFVDFVAYDVLEQLRMFAPDCPELQGNLAQFLQRFELAHAIRLLLEHTGTPYEDKLYSCGEAPDYDKSQWINEKEKLGLDFPNLPYFIDGDVKLTQSNAILRYIARKHNMCGDTEEERQRVDVLENQVMDFRMSLVMVCYSPDFEKLKLGYLEQLPGKLRLFSTFLGDRKWFAGEKLTFVDFLMFDVLDQNCIFAPRCLEPYSNLRAFMERFGALEKVAAYLKSSRFQKMPINNKMAKWGGKKE